MRRRTAGRTAGRAAGRSTLRPYGIDGTEGFAGHAHGHAQANPDSNTLTDSRTFALTDSSVYGRGVLRPED